jgi:protease-4
MSEAQREATNSILDSLYSQIVDGIAKSRKLTPAEVRRAIDEGLLTPGRAKSLKLVDELLYADQVEDELSKRFGNYAEVKPRSYKKSGSLHLGRRNRIAVINTSGVIISGKSGTGSFGGEFIGSETVVRLLKDVREDGGVRAVVLRVDSPGGSGVASDAIWRETQLLKRSKPLVVSMGDVAASGGYYMAMGADAIVAEPATITGSIGVISGKFNMRGFYEDWLGLHRDQIKRGENADLFSDYQGFTDAQRASIRAQIEDFYHEFVHKAAEGRGRKDEEIDRIGQGRIWSGEQAKENGLVDELGGLRKAVEIAKQRANIPASEGVSLDMYPRRKSLLQALSGGEEDDTLAQLLSPRVSLPAQLRGILSELEVRERIIRDGPVLWAGEL